MLKGGNSQNFRFTFLFEDSLVALGINNTVALEVDESLFGISSVAVDFDLEGLVFGGRAVE